jgi:ribosomal-protein-alanine N-acetyltransferase
VEPEEVETARLVLRRPRMNDAASIFERYASDPDVTRFLGWPRHASIHATEAFLQFSEQEWERWPVGPYLILSRANGRLLGGSGLSFQSAHEAMTGYVLAKDVWGRGYATETLTAVVAVARRLGVRRLTAQCHPEHWPSRRVLEKCGFVRDDPPTLVVEFPNLTPGGQQEAACFVLLLS